MLRTQELALGGFIVLELPGNQIALWVEQPLVELISGRLLQELLPGGLRSAFPIILEARLILSPSIMSKSQINLSSY